MDAVVCSAGVVHMDATSSLTATVRGERPLLSSTACTRYVGHATVGASQSRQRNKSHRIRAVVQEDAHALLAPVHRRAVQRSAPERQNVKFSQVDRSRRHFGGKRRGREESVTRTYPWRAHRPCSCTTAAQRHKRRLRQQCGGACGREYRARTRRHCATTALPRIPCHT